jgi:hypothetical protein
MRSSSNPTSNPTCDKLVNDRLVRSVTAEGAYKLGFSVAIDGIPVTGGLLFQFSPTFAQLRLDKQDTIPKDRKDPNCKKFSKYLSLGDAIDRDCAYIPDDCKAVTEGMKDALVGTQIGGIPTGAVAGVSHVTKALPKGCGLDIVFDADTLVNFEVLKNLIRGGVHCGGKVAIVPAIDGDPKSGLCEYFKGGKTHDDYQQLLDNAYEPLELAREWFQKQTISDTDVTEAVELAVKAATLFGELFGYASSTAVANIKAMLQAEKLGKYKLTASDILRDSGNTQASKKTADRDDEVNDRDYVDIAIEIGKTRSVLFHSPDPDSCEYAQTPSKTGAMVTYPVNSNDYRKWLKSEFYKETGRGLTSEYLNTALATLGAIASSSDSPELPVSEKRIVEHDGRYYLYLADNTQTVIEYSAVGWNICENPPVMFVFDKYKAPLTIPSKNGSIDKLWKLTRINDTEESPDRLMIVSALVKGLVPGGSDLVLAISGYAGSGKTTTAKYLRALMDPFTKGKVLSKLPENSDDIAIHAMKRRIITVDNITSVSSGQSDFICTIVSIDSGGTSKREQYTNSSEIIHDIQNLVILTSIGNVVTKPDLLERSIVIELPRITSKYRESETELAELFDRHHGEILGGLLDITVAALHYRDNNPCPKFNRLTEFAHLGVGVEKKLNYPIGSIEKRFADNANIANEIAIDASPVASTLRSWILDRQEAWNVTNSELLNILKTHAKKSELAGSLPRTPNALSGELKKCESAFLASRIVISSKRKTDGVYISISQAKDTPKRSTSSTSEGEETPEYIPIEDYSNVDPHVDPSKNNVDPNVDLHKDLHEIQRT